MVKNRHKSQLLAVVSTNHPIIAKKKREKYAKISVKMSIDMGPIPEKYSWVGWFFHFRSPNPSHLSGRVPTPGK